MVICQNNKWIPSPSIHYLYLNLIPHSVISLFWRYFLWDVNIRKQLRLSWQVGYLGVMRVWFQPSLLMCWLKQQLRLQDFVTLHKYTNTNLTQTQNFLNRQTEAALSRPKGITKYSQDLCSCKNTISPSTPSLFYIVLHPLLFGSN